VNYCCLHGEGPNGVDASLAVNNPKPDLADINYYTDADGQRVDLIEAGVRFQTSILGDPGDECRNNADCINCGRCHAESSIINANLQHIDIGPFSVTILAAFGHLLREMFDEIKTARPELFWGLKTAGANCCRPVKIEDTVRVGTLSNHAWGSAIDLYYGSHLDKQGDKKTQAGLLALSRFMNDRKIYWGAGFPTEDSMHFEPSQQLLIEWVCEGKISGVSRVPHHSCPSPSSSAAAAGETAMNDQNAEEQEEAQEPEQERVADSSNHESMEDYLDSNSPDSGDVDHDDNVNYVAF